MRNATVADYNALYASDYMTRNADWRYAGIDGLLSGRHGHAVLEIGAGRGQLAARMRQADWTWIACDPCPLLPSIDRAALPRLGYASGAFAGTVSVDVLEHLPPGDILPAMREMRRVAPLWGVWAIANMPDPHTIDGQTVELHLTQQPAAWWTDMAMSAGARTVRVHATDCAERFWLSVEWHAGIA